MSGWLFVYGTLRRDNASKAALHGFKRRADAPYPTIEPDDGNVVRGQLIPVYDWEEKDRYEGRRPGDPESSLYWRLEIADDAQVYVGNPEAAERHWGEAWGADYTRDSVERELAGAELEVLDR